MRQQKGTGMSSPAHPANQGNNRDDTPGILQNVRVISYNIPDGERPGGIKVRFKIRVVTGKRARDIDAWQARAILEVLQWHRQHQQHP
jgi:hypothetical protein